MKKSLGLLAVIVSTIVVAFASPDHDHGAPTFQPPKGGVLQSTHHNHFELVKKAKTVFIYAYSEKGKPIETKSIKMSAELELPRAKAVTIKLTDKKTHWETELDSKALASHRFSLKVQVDDGKEKDYVKFTVENK
jgi:hypothetical protein